jgi:hypothetical protein
MASASKSTTVKTAARRIRRSTRKSPKPIRSRQRTPTAAKPISSKANASAAPVRRSKKAAILALLQRPDGAAIGDLTAATGWQVHSVRAALTGLRKEGKELVRAKDAAGITHYRLAAEASA